MYSEPEQRGEIRQAAKMVVGSQARKRHVPRACTVGGTHLWRPEIITGQLRDRKQTMRLQYCR
jgi:hypothetical protein